MRDREQQPEEDGEPRAAEVVGDDLRTGRPFTGGSLRCSDAGNADKTVHAAAERIRGRVHRTPTFSSRTLGERVWLKAELFQKTGSFKARGVLNKLASL